VSKRIYFKSTLLFSRHWQNSPR